MQRALLPLIGALLSLLASSGCILVSTEFGRPLPSDAELGWLAPGETTGPALLARLGPPDEYASPHPASGQRPRDPSTLRVVEERDLFGRTTWSWTHERRRECVFVFLPVLTLFRYQRASTRADRLVVLLDDQGRVAEAAVARELDP